MDNASLPICAYLRSVLVNDRDAKATGLALPSVLTYGRTPPMLVGEASHASLTGNSGSKCVSTCTYVIMRLSLGEGLLALFSPLLLAGLFYQLVKCVENSGCIRQEAVVMVNEP